MQTRRPWIVFGGIVAGAMLVSFAPSGGCVAGPARAVEEAGAVWIAVKADSVCGLDDPALLSSPAVVQHASLIETTPEAKRIHDENIDPRSALGIHLLQRAADRVRDECESVRVARGHCSIWKRIQHRDGRPVPDVTRFVAERIWPPR